MQNNNSKVRALSPNRGNNSNVLNGIKIRLEARTPRDEPEFVNAFQGTLPLGALGTYRVRIRLEEDLTKGATLFLDEVTQLDTRPRGVNSDTPQRRSPPASRKNVTVVDFVREVKRAKEHFSKVEGSFAGKEYILRSWKSNDLPRDMGLRASLLDVALEKGLLREEEVPSLNGDGPKVALILTPEGENVIGI